MKIFCIGKNYADHAREMGGSVPEAPIVFMKPSTALLVNNKPFYLPEFSEEVHYEAEIVLRVAKNGRSVQPEFAESYVDAVGFGIDFTARDLQRKCKEMGRPWEIAKGFDNSAPVSEFLPVGEFQLDDISFRLEKNGEIVQADNTGNQIYGAREMITYISRFFKLQTGDLIFTGTPAGVGPVQIGDTLEGFIGGRAMLHCEIK